MTRLLLALAAFAPVAFAEGDFDHDEEAASAIESFHHSIHRSEGCYLVCVYHVATEPSQIPMLQRRGWEQLKISCTVVGRVKGTKTVSDKFTFERKVEGKAGDTSKMIGKLYYVFLYKAGDGRMLVDYQGPGAMARYSAEYAQVANLHVKDDKKQAEQVEDPNRPVR